MPEAPATHEAAKHFCSLPRGSEFNSARFGTYFVPTIVACGERLLLARFQYSHTFCAIPLSTGI